MEFDIPEPSDNLPEKKGMTCAKLAQAAITLKNVSHA